MKPLYAVLTIAALTALGWLVFAVLLKCALVGCGWLINVVYGGGM